MTHSLVAIAFAVVCVIIGLCSADRRAGQATPAIVLATLIVVMAEAVAGLTR